MNDFLLAALLPPGSVEAEVGRFQQEIFSCHGLVSTIALPPLIPLAFLPDAGLPQGFLHDLNALASAPYRITIGAPAWNEGALYLGIDSAGLWLALRKGALSRVPSEPAGLFPAREGFFLGCEELPAGAPDPDRPQLADSGFTSSSLALLRLSTPRPPATWWRDIRWEIAEQIPLRGRRS